MDVISQRRQFPRKPPPCSPHFKLQSCFGPDVGGLKIFELKVKAHQAKQNGAETNQQDLSEAEDADSISKPHEYVVRRDFELRAVVGVE